MTNALVVTEITWNYDHWFVEEDYTFLNPKHVMFVRSRKKKVIIDAEEGPAYIWAYEVYLTHNTNGPICCIVNDRDAFFSALTS